MLPPRPNENPLSNHPQSPAPSGPAKPDGWENVDSLEALLERMLKGSKPAESGNRPAPTPETVQPRPVIRPVIVDRPPSTVKPAVVHSVNAAPPPLPEKSVESGIKAGSKTKVSERYLRPILLRGSGLTKHNTSETAPPALKWLGSEGCKTLTNKDLRRAFVGSLIIGPPKSLE